MMLLRLALLCCLQFAVLFGAGGCSATSPPPAAAGRPDREGSGAEQPESGTLPVVAPLCITPPIDLTGNEVLSRALSGIDAAVATRVMQISGSLKDLLVTWPAEERNGRAKIQLQQTFENPLNTFGVPTRTWSVDNPLAIWQHGGDRPGDNRTAFPVDAQIRPRADADQSSTNRTDQCSLTFETSFSLIADEVSVVVREAQAGDVCRKEFALTSILPEAGRSAALADIVDHIAACAVAKYSIDVDAGGGAGKKLANVSLEEIPRLLVKSTPDPIDLAEVIRAIDSYGSFIRSPNRVSDVAKAHLSATLHRLTAFLVSAETGVHASAKNTLAKYLLVHASVTAHGDDAYADIKHPSLRDDSVTDQDNRAAEYALALSTIQPFRSTAFEWTLALALERHGRLDDAKRVWDRLLTKDLVLAQVEDETAKLRSRQALHLRQGRLFGEAIRRRAPADVGESTTSRAAAILALEDGIDFLILAAQVHEAQRDAPYQRGILAYMLKQQAPLLEQLRVLDVPGLAGSPPGVAGPGASSLAIPADLTPLVERCTHARDGSTTTANHKNDAQSKAIMADACAQLRGRFNTLLVQSESWLRRSAGERLSAARSTLEHAVYAQCQAEARKTSIVAREILGDAGTPEPCQNLDISWPQIPQPAADAAGPTGRAKDHRPGLTRSQIAEELAEVDGLAAIAALLLADDQCKSGGAARGLSLMAPYSTRPHYHDFFASTYAACTLSGLMPEGATQEPPFWGWVASPPHGEGAARQLAEARWALDAYGVRDANTFAARSLIRFAEWWPVLDKYYPWRSQQVEPATRSTLFAAYKACRDARHEAVLAAAQAPTADIPALLTGYNTDLVRTEDGLRDALWGLYMDTANFRGQSDGLPDRMPRTLVACDHLAHLAKVDGSAADATLRMLDDARVAHARDAFQSSGQPQAPAPESNRVSLVEEHRVARQTLATEYSSSVFADDPTRGLEQVATAKELRRKLRRPQARELQARFVEVESRIQISRGALATEADADMQRLVQGFFDEQALLFDALPANATEGLSGTLATFVLAILRAEMRIKSIPELYEGLFRDASAFAISRLFDRVWDDLANDTRVLGGQVAVDLDALLRQVFTFDVQDADHVSWTCRPKMLPAGNTLPNGGTPTATATAGAGEAAFRGEACLTHFAAQTLLDPQLRQPIDRVLDNRSEATSLSRSVDEWARTPIQPRFAALALLWLAADDHHRLSLRVPAVYLDEEAFLGFLNAVRVGRQDPDAALRALNRLPPPMKQAPRVKLQTLLLSVGRTSTRRQASLAGALREEAQSPMFQARALVALADSTLREVRRAPREVRPMLYRQLQQYYLMGASLLPGFAQHEQQHIVGQMVAMSMEANDFSLAKQALEEHSGALDPGVLRTLYAIARWGRGEYREAIELRSQGLLVGMDLRRHGVALGPRASFILRGLLRR